MVRAKRARPDLVAAVHGGHSRYQPICRPFRCALAILAGVRHAVRIVMEEGVSPSHLLDRILSVIK